MNLVIQVIVLSNFVLTAYSALTNVTCFPEHIEVYFDAQALKGSTPYLDDAKCANVSVNRTQDSVIVKVPLFECGTETELAEDYIAFYNKVKVRIDNPGPIIRADDVYPVGCIFGPTFGKASRNNKPFTDAGAIKTYFYGNSSYTFRLELYTDRSFAEIVEFPLSLILKEEIHFELSVNETGDHLALATDECIATPSKDVNDKLRYPMIRESCLLDPTMTEHKPPEDRIRRYSIKSFLFKEEPPTVYFHCYMRVCVGKEMPKCKEGCQDTGVRRRRSSENAKIITYGPILLKSNKEDEDFPADHDEGSLYLTVIGIFAAATLLSCGVIIGAVIYKRRQHPYVQADRNEML